MSNSCIVDKMQLENIFLAEQFVALVTLVMCGMLISLSA